mmetsp:Transcript_44615/g.118421  ORF Transcript_44615/g.118421 Transcript_44615/m.118421 type:complete len:230 (+) Transcript_44615:151-840(+)
MPALGIDNLTWSALSVPRKEKHLILCRPFDGLPACASGGGSHHEDVALQWWPRQIEDVKNFSCLGLVRCERQLGPSHVERANLGISAHDEVVIPVLRPREAESWIVQTSWVACSAVAHQRDLIAAFHWKVAVITVMMTRNVQVDTVPLEERNVCQLHLEVHWLHIFHKPGSVTESHNPRRRLTVFIGRLQIGLKPAQVLSCGRKTAAGKMTVRCLGGFGGIREVCLGVY